MDTEDLMLEVLIELSLNPKFPDRMQEWGKWDGMKPGAIADFMLRPADPAHYTPEHKPRNRGERKDEIEELIRKLEEYRDRLDEDKRPKF